MNYWGGICFIDNNRTDVHNSVSDDCFVLAYSVDHGEMQHFAAYHLGLHCQSTQLGVSTKQRVN